MKVSLALLGVFAVFGAAFASPNEQAPEVNAVPSEPRIFEDQGSGIEDLINMTINEIAAILSKYDPLHIEHLEQDFLGYHGEIRNLHAEGFSNVVATHIKMDGLKLELTIEAPKIVESIENWNFNGALFFGNGSARIEINDLKVKVKTKINRKSNQFEEMQVTPSIGHADVSITGIFNDEEVSQQISDQLNVLLNDVINNDQELHKLISVIVQTILNYLIS